jgi:hypothetical protein
MKKPVRTYGKRAKPCPERVLPDTIPRKRIAMMQDQSGRIHHVQKQKKSSIKALKHSPISTQKTAIETKLALRSISNISLSQLANLQGHDDDCFTNSIESISDNISLISASKMSNMDLLSENSVQGADIYNEKEDSEIYKFFKNQKIGPKHAGLVLDTSNDTTDIDFNSNSDEEQFNSTPKASRVSHPNILINMSASKMSNMDLFSENSFQGADIYNEKEDSKAPIFTMKTNQNIGPKHDCSLKVSSATPNSFINIKAGKFLKLNTGSNPLHLIKKNLENQRLFKVFQDLQAKPFKKSDINNPFEVHNRESKSKTLSVQSSILKRRALSEYNPQKRLFEQSDLLYKIIIYNDRKHDLKTPTRKASN